MLGSGGFAHLLPSVHRIRPQNESALERVHSRVGRSAALGMVGVEAHSTAHVSSAQEDPGRPIGVNDRKVAHYQNECSGSQQHEPSDPSPLHVYMRCSRCCSFNHAEPPNYLFSRKEFGLSPYWPTNAELLAMALIIAQD